MTNKEYERAEIIAAKHVQGYYNDGITSIFDHMYACCKETEEWKDKQINLLLDAIDHAYLQLDGSYGDLALEVVDQVEYLKSLRQ